MSPYKKALFIWTTLVVVLTLQGHTQDKVQQAQLASRINSMHALGTWQGTTPCADCSGIITTLTLYEKAPNDSTEATYKLLLKYIDRGSFTQYGSWAVLRGMPGNPDATVYQLNSDKPDSAQYYLRVDADTLQQLDGGKKPIQSGLNFTLKRMANQSKVTGP